MCVKRKKTNPVEKKKKKKNRRRCGCGRFRSGAPFFLLLLLPVFPSLKKHGLLNTLPPDSFSIFSLGGGGFGGGGGEEGKKKKT